VKKAAENTNDIIVDMPAVENVIGEESIKNRFVYNLIIPGTLQNITLSFIMLPDEISAYKSVLNELISNEDYKRGKLDMSSIKYINYNDFNYGLRWNIEVMAANPLTSYNYGGNVGTIILEEDVPLYKMIFGNNGGMIGLEKTALFISAGSVIDVNPIDTRGYFMTIINIWDYVLDGRYLVNANDVKIIKTLSDRVVYKIIDNECHRYLILDTGELSNKIGLIRSNIKYDENGRAYIRNEGFFIDGFYYWEQEGDYYFDIDGNFVGREDFGPDYSGH
jgi:hypothetical protein